MITEERPNVGTNDEILELARTTVFGEDRGFDGWADHGAYQDAEGRWFNRLGLESGKAHRHISAEWIKDGCSPLATFHDIQEKRQKTKFDYKLPLNKVKMMDGQMDLGHGSTRYEPTRRAVTQLCEIANVTPSYIHELYGMSKSQKETPRNPQLLRKLADTNLNIMLSQIPDEEKDREWLFRTRNDPGPLKMPYCRAILSDQYGVINNNQLTEMLMEAIPAAGIEDSLISYAYDNGDRISFQVFFPDHIKEDPESEYAVGIAAQNSEDGTCRKEISPYILRAICLNGCQYGVRKKKRGIGTVSKVHRGVIDLGMLLEEVKVAVKMALSEGLELFRIMQLTRDTELTNVPAMIAYICKQNRLNKKQGQRIYDSYLQEPHETGYGVVQAITRSAQYYVGEERAEMESMGGEVMAPSLKADKETVIKHWRRMQAIAIAETQQNPDFVKQYIQIAA